MKNKKVKIKFSDKEKVALFIIFIVFFTLLRCILTSQSSINIFYSEYDDLLVIERARNMSYGNWLGEYNHLTLVKGIGFEIFLVIFNFLNISFLNAQNLMYILACLYFVYAIRNSIKNKFYILIIYILMIFNPISFASNTFQRVYRYNIIIFQVIYIISSYYILYENIIKKTGKLWPHILIASIFLTWFRLTIESYIWLMPFVGVVTILLIINIIKNKEKIIRNIIKVLIPIFMMICVVTGIKYVNLKVYNTWVYNEIYETSFADALKAIYSVDVHDNIKLVSVSQKKIEKLYEISPSLKSIKTILDERLEGWKNYDEIANDEIEDGWFYWAFRETVDFSGYDTPEKANNFYKNVASEINSAIEEGKVDSRPVMSNPLMSPFRKEYISEILVAMSKSFFHIISFTDVSPEIYDIAESNYDFKILDKCFDNYNVITTSILCIIALLYKLNIIAFIISFVIYIYMSIQYLIKRKIENKNVWLLTTACILSIIVLIVGVSYTHISAFNSIKSMYLAGAYPLIIIFIWLNIFGYKEHRKSEKENSQ